MVERGDKQGFALIEPLSSNPNTTTPRSHEENPQEARGPIINARGVAKSVMA